MSAHCFWCKKDLPRYETQCIQDGCKELFDVCVECMVNDMLLCEFHQKKVEFRNKLQNGWQCDFSYYCGLCAEEKKTQMYYDCEGSYEYDFDKYDTVKKDCKQCSRRFKICDAHKYHKETNRQLCGTCFIEDQLKMYDDK